VRRSVCLSVCNAELGIRFRVEGRVLAWDLAEVLTEAASFSVVVVLFCQWIMKAPMLDGTLHDFVSR
jgi:hypothetical protein